MSQDVARPSSPANAFKNKAQGAEGETRGCSFLTVPLPVGLRKNKGVLRCEVYGAFGQSVLVTNSSVV